MIELIEEFPQTIVGAIAKGDVTATDYEDVLMPAVRAAFKNHPKVRFYYELGPGFTGMERSAMWDDFKIGMEHWSGWERIAVVTDVPWLAHAVNAFRVLMPCPVRVFPMNARSEGRAWIKASN
jgi:SpoIIAA-like